MIKAIIFDCFGVLVTEAWEPFCYKYFGNNKKQFLTAREIGHKLNRGEIKYTEFIQQVATLAGIKPKIAQDYIDNNKPNLPLFAYIRDHIKPHYKIGMLSNAGDNWLEEMFTPEQLAMFDDTVLSFKFGVIKPNPSIYTLASDRLKVKIEECVFVDDLQKHIDGAQNCGMKAILYKNFAQMKLELEKLLADSNN